MDAGHGAAGDEQRPALDVDGADERAHDRCREHEPGGGVPERRRAWSRRRRMRPRPSCATASAAAFRTDMNDSSAVDDRTTRICRRGRLLRGTFIAEECPPAGNATAVSTRVSSRWSSRMIAHQTARRALLSAARLAARGWRPRSVLSVLSWFSCPWFVCSVSGSQGRRRPTTAVRCGVK